MKKDWKKEKGGPVVGGRLWLCGLGAALAAALVYALTLAGYMFPGESAHLFTQWMGLDALDVPQHPVWGWAVKAVGGVVAGVTGLNAFSLACGALSAGLLCVLVGFFVRLTVGQEDAVRFAGGAASLAGSVAAGVFIFSTAVWQASTHLEFRMFDVMLALALFALFIPMTARPRLHVPLVVLLAVGCAVGVVESPIFVPLLAVYLFCVVAACVRNGKNYYLSAGLFLFVCAAGAAAVFLAVAGNYLELPAAASGGVLTRGDVFDRMLSLAVREMRQWVGGAAAAETSLGWLFVLVLAVLPFVACAFAAPRGLNNERTWSQYLFHAAMTICAILAVATPFAPESLMRLSERLPVATTTLVCAVCGYLAAYWYLLARVPLPAVEFDKVPTEVTFGRRAAPAALMTLLGVAALASLVNAFGCARDRGTFADVCANEILDRLGDRAWFVTDGVLDDHLRHAAAARGKALHLVCLQRAEDEAYLRELAALVREQGLKAGEANLVRSAELGVLPFLEDWLAGDAAVSEKVAIFGAPDLWYKANLQPVPECLFFGGVRDVRKLDGDAALADFRAFWAKIEPQLRVEGVKGSAQIGTVRDALDRKRLWLRRHVGLIANNLGVAMQDLGRDKDAFALYDLVLEKIDADNVCALFNEFEMARAGVREAVARKAEISRRLKALADDPEKRYALWSLSRYYGYIRSPEIFARMGHAWARSGQRGEAIAQIRQAIDLVPRERQSGLLNMMAAIYASGNQRQRSREVYQKVLETDATNHDALMGLMNLALQGGRLAEAKEHLEKAVKAAPNRESSGFDWALLHLMSGNFDAARLALQKVTDLQPKSLRAWALLAGVQLQRFDQTEDKAARDRILEELEGVILPKMEAVADSPRDFHVLITRALVLMRRGGDARAKARDVLVMAHAQRPAAMAVGDMILNLDISLNDAEGAAKHARQVLRQDRRNKFANYVMGSLRLRDGDYPAAEEYLRLSVDTEKPLALAQNDLAEVLRRLQRYAEAEKFARAATANAPELYVAWETLGSSLLDQRKNLDEAEACVRKAVDLAKKGQADDVRMLLTLARVQLAKGDLPQARGTLRTIRRRQGDLTPYDLGELEKLDAAAKGK